MSLYLFDTHGLIGQVATTSGWNDMMQVAQRSGNKLLIELFENGEHEEPEAVADAIGALIKTARMDRLVRRTFRNLAKLLRQADYALISE